jgi:hypothetical protein
MGVSTLPVWRSVFYSSGFKYHFLEEFLAKITKVVSRPKRALHQEDQSRAGGLAQTSPSAVCASIYFLSSGGAVQGQFGVPGRVLDFSETDLVYVTQSEITIH